MSLWFYQGTSYFLCFFTSYHCKKPSNKYINSSYQGFAAGLMLSISFLDLAHNALNSIGFLKGNLWVSLPFLLLIIQWHDTGKWLLLVICCSSCLLLQFFAGVLFFAFIVSFIPEPTVVPRTDADNKQVWMLMFYSHTIYFTCMHIDHYLSMF